MELPSICHENDLLQSDVLSTKKLRLFVLSSKEEQRVHLESLLSKHTKYLLKIYKQIIQSGRFKKTSITLKKVLKNVTEWPNNDPNFILTICKLINQGVKTFNDLYYNTHHKSILSNTVTESNIYDNYNYTSCVNWEIEKTSETPLKKLEFYIDNPETGLKKTDFNIITNKDETDDLNNNTRDHCNNDLTDDMYNNIYHDNVNQKQTNNHNIYTFVDEELHLRSDIEDLEWNSIDSHKGELIIAYDNKIGNKTLCPRKFYVFYIKPNQEGNGHLIHRLDKDQIVVTKNHRTVPVTEDIDHTSIKNEDQYTQETMEILQPSLFISLRDKFLRSTLLVSLRYEFLQSSLPVSLQYGFLQSSLHSSLQHGFLQSSLLVSLRSNIIHTFTLSFLWNIFL